MFQRVKDLFKRKKMSDDIGYIGYSEMLGQDVTKMLEAEHLSFRTEDAFGTVFFKDSKPLLAYVYTWSGPGPEELLRERGYKVVQTDHRGNGHYTCALTSLE
jgi:hypothetical protein